MRTGKKCGCEDNKYAICLSFTQGSLIPRIVLLVIEQRSSNSIGVAVSATVAWIVAPKPALAQSFRGEEPPDVKRVELLASYSHFKEAL